MLRMIEEKIKCLWCYRLVPITEIIVSENEDHLDVWYRCDCNPPRSSMGIRHSGEHIVQAYYTDMELSMDDLEEEDEEEVSEST